MSRTQFGRQVKVFRSDNALEFDDKKCGPFFNKLGMNKMIEQRGNTRTYWRWLGL